VTTAQTIYGRRQNHATGRGAVPLVRSITSPTHTPDTPNSIHKNKPTTSRSINQPKRLKRMHRQVAAFAQAATADLITAGFRVTAISQVLTYKYPGHWSPEHISSYIEKISARLRRRGKRFAYVWTLEEKDGRYHYHVVWLLSHRQQLPHPTRKPDHGDTPWIHGWAGSRRALDITRTIYYVAKTKSKENLPASARIFGTGGNSAEAKQVARWYALPMWLREKVGIGETVKRASGGGYYSVGTGEIWRSPWIFTLEQTGPARWKPVFTRRHDMQ